MNENTKKVVVCTGSGRHGGLGEAILLRFANEGYKVVVTDIGNNSDRHLASSSDMESVAAGLKSLGVEVLCLPCDVRLPDSVAASPRLWSLLSFLPLPLPRPLSPFCFPSKVFARLASELPSHRGGRGT